MARNRVELRPLARRDLSDIAVYLATESGQDELAYRFLDAVESSLDRLTALPEMGAIREFLDPRLEGVRRWRLAGFGNYAIYYRPLEAGIEVIRVLHAKQDAEGLLST